MDCRDIQDDIALCALGTLPPAEEELVRAHASSCPDCGPVMARADEDASRLALTVPLVRAPAAMRAATLAAIRDEAEQPTTAPPSAPAGSRTRGWRRWRLPAHAGGLAAALMLVPLAGLLVWPPCSNAR